MNIFTRLKQYNLLRTLHLESYTQKGIIMGTIAVLILSNVLVSLISFRVDVSQGKAYTLSPSSKQLIGELKKPVLISFYASSDLPSSLQPLRREVNDLLSEYDFASSQVSVKKFDPKSDESARTKAKEAGLPEIPFQQQERNKFEVAASIFGIVIEYDKKKEIIPQVTDVESLEYNVSSIIYKLSRKELPKIGIIASDASFSPRGDEIATLKQVLRSQFDMQSISLPPPKSEENASETKTPFHIDPSFKAVLFFGTEQSTADKEVISELRSYLQKGGKVIAFVNGMMVSDSLQTKPLPDDFAAFLKSEGITIEKNILLSTAAEIINLGGQSGMSLLSAYPMWLRTNMYDARLPYFANMSYLTFPWVSSLTLKKDESLRPIIFTTRQSWQISGAVELDPQKIKEPTRNELKQFVIGAEKRSKNDGRLLLIASSRFGVDRYAPPRSGNVSFLLNVLSDYASKGALSGIRQRFVAFYPLPDLTPQMQSIFQYVNILILPGIFALYGAVRIWQRNNRTQKQND